MRIILGIDPGLVNVGWGVIAQENNTLKYIASGTIKTSSKESICSRLARISGDIKTILSEFDPDEVATEESYVSKNGQSTLKLGQARGAIIVTGANAGFEVAEYAPTLVKKSIVGAGRAEKEQVQMMVKMLLPKAQFDSEHAADALAIAICHANHHTRR